MKAYCFSNDPVTNESCRNFGIKIFEIVGMKVKIWANNHKWRLFRDSMNSPPFYNDDEKCGPPWIGSLYGGNWFFFQICLPILQAELPEQYFCYYLLSWQRQYSLIFLIKKLHNLEEYSLYRITTRYFISAQK